MQGRGDGKATIVHAIPGRVRVRLDRSLRSPVFMHTLVDALSQVEGVRRVQANPSTGSLLLLYDPQLLSLEQLYQAARAADVTLVIPATPAAPDSAGELTTLAQRINSAIGRLDQTVFGFTGGTLDLRTLFPLGLATAALRQIATSGGNLAAAPWYVLLWYSFESFTKFNSRKVAVNPETRGRGSAA